MVCWLVRRGSASSVSSSGVCERAWDSGSRRIVGMPVSNRAILIMKGSQRFWLMVNAASEGPTKFTTYVVEDTYEKYDALFM